MINSIELRRTLQSNDWTNDPFSTLSKISKISSENKTVGRELIIRALAKKAALAEEYKSILYELTAKVGLHPYIEDLNPLSLRSSLIHAAHRAEGSMDDYVLHSSQAKILSYLVDGYSIVLSAPTSFGKSLLIDLLIAHKDFNNVVLILPTIALVEETRRRMARFSEKYSIITTNNQIPSKNNIFVLTQERYLSMQDNIESVDFFAIDEFYKLSISEEGSRSTQLNQAFLKLKNTGAQFYMLGPSIRAIPNFAEEILKCKFFIEDFHTVAIELHALSKKPNKIESLASLLDNSKEPTLIYCQSPNSARTLLKKYLEIRKIDKTKDSELIEAAKWTAKHYHVDWLVSKALAHGIGIHHGKLPRALGRFMIRAFEDRKLQILICTSTLIEGVNTAAKNVVIFDNNIGSSKQPLDFFTFNNIRGRSGRMFKHFIGNVYYFDAPPQENLPFVDIPAINPTESTPSSLLLQIDKELIPKSIYEKYLKLTEDPLLPVDFLKKISGIEPEYLIATASYLYSLNTIELRKFIWGNRPTYEDVQLSSDIIWNQLGGSVAAKKSALLSAKMMTYWIWELYKNRNVSIFKRTMIDSQIQKGTIPDNAVENVLSFLRGWASFNYPKYLTALSEIAALILKKRGFNSCNYYPFAITIEHLFQPTSFSTLEEYGLPSEISEKLLNRNIFKKDDNISSVISSLKNLNAEHYTEGVFERRVMEDFQAGIGSKIIKK